MKKPKKITIRFFLNTNLAPISQQNQLAYPTYMQVTYNRKNTQIKAIYAGFYQNIEDFKQHYPQIYHFEERIMHKSVAYELEKDELLFRLKGISEKYEVYAQSIHFITSAYLKAKLKNIVPRLSPQKYIELLNFDRNKVDFLVLYDACLRLFDNIEPLIDPLTREEILIYRAYYAAYQQELADGKYAFPVIIDWLEGSHLQELEKRIAPFIQNDLDLLKKAILFINKMVSTKLGMR